MNKTIFIDIDGTIFPHVGSLTNIIDNYQDFISQEPLPGVKEKFNEWAYKGYVIIITTARPISLESITVQQLENAGLFYDGLVMGLPRGPRVVINDIKPATEEYPELLTAEAVNLVRNEGLAGVNV